jgi:hypothetical protein
MGELDDSDSCVAVDAGLDGGNQSGTRQWHDGIYIFRLHQFGNWKEYKWIYIPFGAHRTAKTVVFSSFLGTWANRAERYFPVHSKVRRFVSACIEGLHPGCQLESASIIFYYRDVIVQKVWTVVSWQILSSSGGSFGILDRVTVALLTWYMQDAITHLSHPRSFFN